MLLYNSQFLLKTAQITKIFYPESVNDNYDNTDKNINDTGVITEKTEISSDSKKLNLLNFGNIK